MADMEVDSGSAVIVPLNVMPLLDDTDFKAIETGLVYNSAGLVLTWNFQTTAGVMTSTAITATTSGLHDISEPLADVGMYGIEIPASGGNWANDGNAARIGTGWFTGVATGILPWRGPFVKFRAAAINNRETDGDGTGTELTAIPWNAAWDAEVQSECDDAITANTLVLDLPTTAEFNARTLAAADYVVVGDTIAGVTTATNVTTVNGLAANVITAASIADAAIDNATFAADVGTTALATNNIALASAKGAHDSLVASHVLATTFGKYLGGAPAGATLAADVATVDTVVDGIATSVGALATTTDVADAILTRDWTSVTGEAARSVLNALRILRNKWTISAGTLTVTEEDDTTTAWTGAVTTDSGADPITTIDPT